MAANATITVNDGMPTPVAHAFDPISVDKDLATYQNKSANTFDGRETLKLRHSVGSTVRTGYIELRSPRVIDTAGGGDPVYAVADFGTVKVTFLIPKTWTVQLAENLRVEIANVLLATPVLKIVDEGEFVW